MTYQAHQAALVSRTVLALNRPVEIGQPHARAVDILREHSLKVWYDPGHRFDAGPITAFRAMDDAGRFCWVLRVLGHRLELSREVDPYEAMAQREPRPGGGRALPWTEIRAVARALRRREVRLQMVATDFEGMPALYVWLGRLNLPGWVAGWLLPVAPALGTAIWTAHCRTLGQRQMRAANLATA